MNNKNEPLQVGQLAENGHDGRWDRELVKLVGRWNGTGVGVGRGNGNGISSMNGKLDDKLIG